MAQRKAVIEISHRNTFWTFDIEAPTWRRFVRTAQSQGLDPWAALEEALSQYCQGSR